ncbi:hypothetical protein BDV25DRAFT_164042 [Aspergillus avenaceus]|uniref:Ell binding protein Ebp1 C-terminal domain-containing protein n=1 Tax=Aspergillus avenaceus TaxID=36643 RepID=A0A5N6THA4_ASPAV|nr:hypothetical protein BDV25DRAFT_164042 [Aspergillus avenaceus]
MSENRPYRTTNDDIKAAEISNEQTPLSDQYLIDQRFRHLKEDVLPIYPFLLTVPTDVPFRLGNRFVNNWAVGNDGPFTPEEHQLQYMTFLTHHEGDSLLVAVGDWSSGTENAMTDQRSGLQSATGTPLNGPTKKKISLKDYKHKRKTGAGASPSPIGPEASSRNLPTISQLEDNQQAIRFNSVGDNPQKTLDKAGFSQTSTRSEYENQERKRPPELETERMRTREEKGSELALFKRPKISPEMAAESYKSNRSKPNGLPTLLSPTLPPTSASPRLPRLLSPTLPPDLEKELAKLGEEITPLDASRTKSTLNSDASRARVPKAKPTEYAVSTDLAPINGQPGVQDKSSSSVSDKRLLPVQGTVNSYFNESPNFAFRHQTDNKPNGHEDLAKPQLTVKLKYGRGNRKRVEALLKFSGKRKAALPTPHTKITSDSDLIQPKKLNDDATKSLTTECFDSKHHRPEGKSKHVATNQAPRVSASEKMRTPVSSNLNIIAQNQEKAKQATVTPTRDLIDSTYCSESIANDGRKSSQLRNKHSSTDFTAPAKQSPSFVNSQSSTFKNGERRAWKDESQKYGNMGRELKHAAKRHTHVDEKLAAATAIEAILCFILAFVADDQSKALSRQVGDSSSWLSILAYWGVVKDNSVPFPRLHSLCLILGATSYDAIHALDLERLAVTPLPGENTPVPTPGSDGNTGSVDESKRIRNEFSELKCRLLESYKKSQRLWIEGSQGLSEDILSCEFPDTWSKRSKNSSEQAKRRLKPGDYSGDYFLPLGRIITPVEIARLGYSILKEWCHNEGVEWTGRLNLQ